MIPNRLFQILEHLAQVYPHWRFGQLAANMAGLADLSLEEVSDEQLAAAALRHLDKRLDVLQISTPELEKRGHSSHRQQLLDALRAYYGMYPDSCLGKVLMEASKTKVNIFDIEDERLLEGVKNLPSKRAVPTT